MLASSAVELVVKGALKGNETPGEPFLVCFILYFSSFIYYFYIFSSQFLNI
jgi:hypothetical protein